MTPRRSQKEIPEVRHRLLYTLTITMHADYSQSAKYQYVNPNAVLANRGMIYLSDYSKNEKILAVNNANIDYVYSNNRELEISDEMLIKVSEILQIDQNELKTLLEKNT